MNVASPEYDEINERSFTGAYYLPNAAGAQNLHRQKKETAKKKIILALTMIRR